MCWYPILQPMKPHLLGISQRMGHIQTHSHSARRAKLEGREPGPTGRHHSAQGSMLKNKNIQRERAEKHKGRNISNTAARERPGCHLPESWYTLAMRLNKFPLLLRPTWAEFLSCATQSVLSDTKVPVTLSAPAKTSFRELWSTEKSVPSQARFAPQHSSYLHDPGPDT